MMNAAARLPWELGGSKVQEWHRVRLAYPGDRIHWRGGCRLVRFA
jgi:hypothetical protein